MNKFATAYGFPDFPLCSFRGEKEAGYTTIFGPDFSGATNKSVRQHVALDRGHGNKWDVFAPFDLEKIEMILNDDFGTMTIMYPVGADFTVRVAHIHPNDFSPEIMKVMNKGLPVANKTRVGKVGNYSKTYTKLGAHTHTEIVSIGEKSAICEEIMNAKYKNTGFMTGTELRSYLLEKYEEYRKTWPAENKPALDAAALDALMKDYEADYKGRNCINIGRYSVFKIDYLDYKTKRTWYSSRELFNF